MIICQENVRSIRVNYDAVFEDGGQIIFLHIYNKVLFFERFVERKYTLQGVLYLKRKIIYLSTTYVKYISLAYSVFLKNQRKRT